MTPALPADYRAQVKRKSSPVDFEKSLAELEQLVEKLEHGDVPLEDALKTFERGVTLTRECQTALKTAQQRVDILLKRDGAPRLTEFAASEGADSAALPAADDDE